eukprot:TRINITY_DN3118_c1_g2_i1.p1 TRINITY_DN3118_c1_g2~~TRINITY_DN3118_c1_g2_i1.p1  ORF type:complete len:248 (+),score=78.99 TRINITY_DN3118_c1_g2_i1:84-746(+)
MALQQAVQQAQAQGLATGQVKSYNDKNGYGFVGIDGYGMDAKFGRNDIASGVPSPGATVSFMCTPQMDGRVVASMVTVLGGGSGGGMKRNAGDMGMGGMGMMGMGGGLMGGVMAGMMGGMGGPGMAAMGGCMGGGAAKKPRVEATPTGVTTQGTIKKYNGANGWGFISSPSISGDCFFGKEQLPQDAQGLQGNALQGRTVSFSVAQAPDGKMRAMNVVLM